MSSDATLRALSRLQDDDLPFCCLHCGRIEEFERNRCTDCHQPRGDNR